MLGLEAGMHYHSWQIGVFFTLPVIPKHWPGYIPFGPRAPVTPAPILPDLFFSALWPQANDCIVSCGVPLLTSEIAFFYLLIGHLASPFVKDI